MTPLEQPACRTTGKTRILVVDDHPIVRQGLSQLINQEADLTVCGQAEEATAALEAMTTLRPDFVIVDISLNGPDGLDLLKTIREKKIIDDAYKPQVIAAIQEFKGTFKA